jgi:uncharacterized protein
MRGQTPVIRPGKRRRRWWIVPLLLLGASPVVARVMAYRMVERNSLISRPVGPETPATYGAPFETLSIPRASYRLDGRLVKVSDRAPLLVIFHGTAESVSYWADVQALLYRNGISSYVFDYSGFGNSGGERTADALAGDISVAWTDAVVRMPFAARRIALGYSLGTGFLVEKLGTLTPAPDGLTLVAGYSSAREAAVSFGSIPAWAAPVLPDLWNTARDIKLVTQPTLIVHSDSDQIFPLRMAERVFAAAPNPKSFIVVHGYTHEDGHIKPDATFWAGVISFAQSGTLPQSSN